MKNKTKTISKIAGLSLVGIALWFWDEVIFVAPIAAATAVLGPLRAWLIMGMLFFGVFFILSVISLKHFRQKRTNKLGKWIEKEVQKSKKSRFYRPIKTGAWAAIIASCFFLGGLITSHIVYDLRLWPEKGIVSTSLVCNFWFAAVWVGFYSGAFGSIFYVFKQWI